MLFSPIDPFWVGLIVLVFFVLIYGPLTNAGLAAAVMQLQKRKRDAPLGACFSCGKQGHLRKNCPEKGSGSRGSGTRPPLESLCVQSVGKGTTGLVNADQSKTSMASLLLLEMNVCGQKTGSGALASRARKYMGQWTISRGKRRPGQH